MSFRSFDNLADNIRSDANIAQTYLFNFNSGAQPNEQANGSIN